MPDFELENSVNGVVVGVDEAGRGPWAGPVVAGAVHIVNKGLNPELLAYLDDSKKLSPKLRDRLYALLLDEQKKGVLKFGIGLATAREVDEHNILQATFLAMKRAVDALEVMPNLAIVDGNQVPKSLKCPVKAVVKGDAKSFSIAAASVVAKVYRDRLMGEVAQKYPFYAFEKNAGYGTPKHVEGLEKYGVCPEHRLSYKPVKLFKDNEHL